jgi:hypothetical protein
MVNAPSHRRFLASRLYQPLAETAIRRCPLLYKSVYNRHTPVTERSVALHAPRCPKCPRSASGSKRPSNIALST